MNYGTDVLFMWFLGVTLGIYLLLRVVGFNHHKAARIKELIGVGVFVSALVFLVLITIIYS